MHREGREVRLGLVWFSEGQPHRCTSRPPAVPCSHPPQPETSLLPPSPASLPPPSPLAPAAAPRTACSVALSARAPASFTPPARVWGMGSRAGTADGQGTWAELGLWSRAIACGQVQAKHGGCLHNASAPALRQQRRRQCRRHPRRRPGRRRRQRRQCQPPSRARWRRQSPPPRLCMHGSATNS